MKLTNNQLRQIIKEELQAVMREGPAILQAHSDPTFAIEHLQQKANSSPGGRGADGKMRGEAYISQEELKMALGAIEKFEKVQHRPSKQVAQLLTQFGPSHEKDDTLEYRKYHGYMKHMMPEMYS